jgi:uncharacterized protein
MIARMVATPVRVCLLAFAFAVLIAVLALVGPHIRAQSQTPAPPQAQSPAQPSAAAVALAREIIVAKGSSGGFESVGASVIERVKALFQQTSPALGKELNEVAAKLRVDYAARFAEPTNNAAKLYAGKFTEPELKDILAFYKSPLGKKVVVQEPLIIEESMSGLDQWASALSEEIIAKMRAEMKKKGHDL